MKTTEFFHFMLERHRIYTRRAAGEPWPWTEDRILQEWRFCNVFRELDTTTQWIRIHWRGPLDERVSETMLWFMMCVARQINYIPTLAALTDAGFPFRWDPDQAVRTMQALAAQGKKVYTSAYMLRGPAAGGDKASYTIHHVLQPLWEARDRLTGYFTRPEPGATLEGFWSLLCAFHGWGPFLAYEVVTDLRHTRLLRHAPDILTWANPGPGAVRGLNRLANRPLTAIPPRYQLINEMRDLLEGRRRFIPDEFPPLELRDIEHTLCEFDKYERVRLGEGAPRQRYHHG